MEHHSRQILITYVISLIQYMLFVNSIFVRCRSDGCIYDFALITSFIAGINIALPVQVRPSAYKWDAFIKDAFLVAFHVRAARAWLYIIARIFDGMKIIALRIKKDRCSGRNLFEMYHFIVKGDFMKHNKVFQLS